MYLMYASLVSVIADMQMKTKKEVEDNFWRWRCSRVTDGGVDERGESRWSCEGGTDRRRTIKEEKERGMCEGSTP